MKTAEIHYQGALRTRAVHLRSGAYLTTDAPLDNRGKGAAFSPTDCVAVALGSCMLTLMGIKARDRGWPLEGTRVEVEKEMASNPRRIAKITLSIWVPHDLEAEARTLLTRAARSCPVARSLHPEIEQSLHFFWGAS